MYSDQFKGQIKDAVGTVPLLHDGRHAPSQNKFLARLTVGQQESISQDLEWVPLTSGRILHESGQALRHVYFPTTSAVSLLSLTRDGESAEVAIIGNDGLVGVELLLGGGSTANQAIVQSSGHAYRLLAHKFIRECHDHDELIAQVLCYTQSLVTQIGQTAVCNRHHSVFQRLCRRLLLALDRSTGDRLDVTQESLANLLGVRREGITEATGRLRAEGVIESSRGHINVLNRKKLERLCCECYAALRRETERLMPTGRPAGAMSRH